MKEFDSLFDNISYLTSSHTHYLKVPFALFNYIAACLQIIIRIILPSCGCNMHHVLVIRMFGNKLEFGVF